MNTRNTPMEVAEYLGERGLLNLNDGESIGSATIDDDGNLVAKVVGGNVRKVFVPLDFIRETLNVNAYWEGDPYNGGEKYLIVPND